MQEEDVDTFIVSRLGDPWKLLFVDFDIGIMSGLVFMVFFAANLQLSGLAIGTGIGYWLHTARQNKPKGYLRHLTYWLLPHRVTFLTRTTPSYCMETLG